MSSGSFDFTNVSNLTMLSERLYLLSNSFTGDMSGVSNLSLLTFLRLVSSQLTYTYTTLTSNFGDFYLRLKTNELSSSTDIDNMLIDIDNNATVKSGTIDLRSTGAGSPTATSLSARNSLIAKGRTILTN